MFRYGVPAGVSVLLGAVAAVLVNVFTDGWSWPVGVGLAGAVLAAATWEIWRGSRSGGAVRAERTGAATATGTQSRANSGIRGEAATDATAQHTGDARSADGGNANSGVEQYGR